MNDLPLEMIQELTTFFKALVDAERLRIAGRLARQSLSAEQLAAQLEIKPATLARHLEKLAEAGLVRAEAKGATTRYTLRLEAARALAARLTAQPLVITPEAAGDYDRQVLTHYLRSDGTLKEIPVQEKKMLAVLRYLAGQFAPGQRYTEKQVNAVISRFHADTASLRRYLIDFKFLERTTTGAEYWRQADAS